MQCVMCKTGEVKPAAVKAELRVGTDRLLVPVRAEACAQCGETYYSAETLQHLEKVKVAFTQKAIALHSVGSVYQVSEV